MLRLLPSHESNRPAQYIFQGDSFIAERKVLIDIETVLRSIRIAKFSPFIVIHGYIRSSGRIKRLIELRFDTKHPFVIEACHTFVKLFLQHIQLK